jgi:hypothetical protein
MHKEYTLHSSDLGLPQSHPLHDHLFILKQYKARPMERKERWGMSPDDPPAMLLMLRHRNESPTPYGMEIPVADEHSFIHMWNVFSRCQPTEVLKGFGMEGMA